MATTRKKTSTRTPAKPATTEPRVREIVDEMLRTAFRDHSRDLETVLNDIDRRLKNLEPSR